MSKIKPNKEVKEKRNRSVDRKASFNETARRLTRDAMDALFGEQDISARQEQTTALVGLKDEPNDQGEPVVIAGAVTPQARAKRYRKLREGADFWSESDPTEDLGETESE